MSSPHSYLFPKKISCGTAITAKNRQKGGKTWGNGSGGPNSFSKKAIKGINRQQKLRAIQIRSLLVIKKTKMSIILNIDLIIF